ncbi:MAG: glycerol-3-phosphate dehydrogenase [Pseudohongiellaceae bacterium]
MSETHSIHDVLVIGGGINGAGIAADAAGRGLSVVLCEKADLAGATSSWSTKLIHGGLRYLEFYEFRLVRKALQEREVLTKAAKHIIHPIPILIPQLPHSRHPLLIRAGLFLYDNLARRKLFKSSRSVRFDDAGILNSTIKKGFEYWDAQVDDSRLVVINALQAKARSAEILTRTECVGIRKNPEGWLVTLKDTNTGSTLELIAKSIVNASGPWVSDLLKNLQPESLAGDLRLVKGSHIIVPKVDPKDNAYMLQHHDGRVIFALPYLGKYTLIGTTEEEFTGNLDKPEISTEEIDYLISVTNLYFKKKIARGDIVSTYAGVRPLMEEEGKAASKVSRDYFLDLKESPYPLISVYGGKVTTYRVLAEDVVNKLRPYFLHMRGPWTRNAILPGGDFEMGESLFAELASKYAWLGPDLIDRWRRSYGSLAFQIVGKASSKNEMGVCFGQNLYQQEVDYLCREEWAQSAEDILWRRTKLGLVFTEKQTQSLDNYIQQSVRSR